MLETVKVEDVKDENKPQYDFSEHEADLSSRIYTMSPEETERYYLSALLPCVFRANCYEDICTLNDGICANFGEVFSKKGSTGRQSALEEYPERVF